MATRKSAIVDSTNEFLGAENEIVIGDHDAVEDVRSMATASMDQIELEAFMNEEVTIVLMSSGREHEVPYATPSVNGEMVVIPRETPVNVKRKYVEVLARGKKTDFDQNLDERKGEGMNVLRERHSTVHPFSLLRDPNPRGAAWLGEILAGRR